MENSCVCENIKKLLSDRKSLPKETELLNKDGQFETLSDVALESANRDPHIYGDNPFWTVGWLDLLPRLRLRKKIS